MPRTIIGHSWPPATNSHRPPNGQRLYKIYDPTLFLQDSTRISNPHYERFYFLNDWTCTQRRLQKHARGLPTERDGHRCAYTIRQGFLVRMDS